MKRPMGVTIVAVFTFWGAVILALGSVALFCVAAMGMTGTDAGDPVSVAIAGMAVAGGFSLLVLAGVAVCLAIGVLRLREWARVVSIASIAAGIGCTFVSLFAFRVMFPAVPSVVCHLVVTAAAVWMLVYLLLPRVKQAFSALPA